MRDIIKTEEGLYVTGDLTVSGKIVAGSDVVTLTDSSYSLYIPPANALRVKRLREDATIPTKAHMGDLGFDLYALEDVTLNPGEVTKVRTGIACGFPSGYGALIRDRSSVATKKQVFVVAGVIDQGYTGEIIVAFFNPGRVELLKSAGTSEVGWHTQGRYDLEDNGFEFFQKGDKIAQMILTPVVNFPVEEVDDLAHTARGSGGFGSTGR